MTSKEQTAMGDEKLDVRLNWAGNTTIGIADMAGHISPWVLEEYAPRLVAAWNACAGIETEILETLVDHGVSLNTAANIATAEARATEAEALLRRAVDEWECEFSVENSTVMAIKDFLERSKP